MAITGDGAFPLRSAWLGRSRGRGANPRKIVNIAAQNSANAPVWIDFFFASAAPPGIVLTALNGTYTISGQTATLARTRELTALNGSYAITGQTAALAYGRVLTPLNGSYAITGQTANVLIGRQLTALNGTYVVSGQTSDISFGRLLSTQNGVYSVAGQAVDITVGGGPAPVTALEFYVDIRSFTERRRF